jgi:hypothetical protein
MNAQFEKWWSKQFKFESKHKLALDAWNARGEADKAKAIEDKKCTCWRCMGLDKDPYEVDGCESA